MAPTIAPGDHIMMEGVTFLARKPHRGDLVIFKTEGLRITMPPAIFVMRVAGEPGDRLRIAEGHLFVNGSTATLSNVYGEIKYVSLPDLAGPPGTNEVTVPLNHYFVLGDASANSYDSRFLGPVPSENILGRVWVRYWPLDRAGMVK